jgi:hypothetical protein
VTAGLFPWRFVLKDDEPVVRTGRGSVLGPDTSRRARWWVLDLECGHRVERSVRYRKRPERYPAGRSRHDVMPHPDRVRCEHCPPGDPA